MKKLYLLLFIAVVFATSIFSFSYAFQDKNEERKQLEKELQELEKKIREYEKNIYVTQKEKEDIQSRINSLKNQIKALDLEIQKGELVIQDINIQIQDTQSSIEKMERKIQEYQKRLSEILNEIYKRDQDSLVEIFFLGGISSFFSEIENLESLNNKTYDFLTAIKNLKKDLEGQKTTLEKEKDEHEKTIILNKLKVQEQEQIKKDKEILLKQAEEKELTYKQRLEQTKKRAQEIRSRIFELSGISDAPTFGEAYDLAKLVEQYTNVRPAFLLAILTQESNIGKNVGGCYLKDAKTGSGIRVKTGEWLSRVMHPRRDVPVFLEITRKAGRDPFSTVVSCPLSFGWGGAMGPAQFIPSTWKIFDKRVSSITGRPADPWNIKDAFIASALYLSDAGASKRTYESEWKAALIYFSGGVNLKYRFYADSVMRIVKKYEEDIAELEKGNNI